LSICQTPAKMPALPVGRTICEDSSQLRLSFGEEGLLRVLR
jgi:hypothetical protein